MDVVIDPKDIELKAARSGGAGDIPLLECVILLVLYSMTLGVCYNIFLKEMYITCYN